MSISPITAALLDISALSREDIPEKIRRLARLSLFDWLTVMRAGRDEPVSRITRDLVLAEGGAPVASLVGGGRAPARAAAMANGAASHALDYDDTHFGHVGHLSVAILPAAVAAGEEMNASIGDIVTAFVLGAEGACRFGAALGRAHYAKGFHQTATSGAVGAAIAAGRLYGLSPEGMRNALSLIGTRASGLISQFGTMGKPFNAGLAASNGVEAAQLAKRGFISCDDGLAGPQGFIDVCSGAPEMEAALAEPPPTKFLFESNKYKLHACCHGLHAMIEGLREVVTRENVEFAGIEGVEIRVNPRWLKVCDLKAPRSGLEVKFSYAWLSGMVARGVNTAARESYSAEMAEDTQLKEFAKGISVEGDPKVSDTQANGKLRLNDGRRLEFARDLDDPIPLDDLAAGLKRKSAALLGEKEADAIWRAATQPGDAKIGGLLDFD